MVLMLCAYIYITLRKRNKAKMQATIYFHSPSIYQFIADNNSITIDVLWDLIYPKKSLTTRLTKWYFAFANTLHSCCGPNVIMLPQFWPTGHLVILCHLWQTDSRSCEFIFQRTVIDLTWHFAFRRYSTSPKLTRPVLWMSTLIAIIQHILRFPAVMKIHSYFLSCIGSTMVSDDVETPRDL